jgi:hypothetical protein
VRNGSLGFPAIFEIHHREADLEGEFCRGTEETKKAYIVRIDFAEGGRIYLFPPKGGEKNLPDVAIQETLWKKIWQLLKPDFPPFLFSPKFDKAERRKDILSGLSGGYPGLFPSRKRVRE